MRYTNFIVQAVLIAVAIVFGTRSVFSNDLLSLFIVQFLIGIWQYPGCLMSFTFGCRSRLKKQYIIFSSLYLIILFLLIAIFRPSTQIWYLFMLTIPPWTLGIFYLVITYRETFPRKDSRFLPHLNF